MELEEQGTITTKRKLTALESEAHVPGGVGEDGGGADRISNLANDTLRQIISLLPTREGARTQALASRWRDIWLSAPLNLDCRHLTTDRDALAGVVSRTLSSSSGLVRRFCARDYIPAAAMDAWLRSPALDGLQELEVVFFPIYHGRKRGPGPPAASTFRFSATLRHTTIGRCVLSDGAVQGLHFPQLRQLALEEVRISGSSLHGMIAGCPALECLLMDLRTIGVCLVRINHPSLRTIGVRASCGELVVEDAPCLQRLLHLHDSSHLKVTARHLNWRPCAAFWMLAPRKFCSAPRLFRDCTLIG